ncbi:MAG: LysR family transcriptional regulator [Burkholderia sp.]
MDELLSMRLFIRVADQQSFAKAAADLHISNPSATRMIMGLEDRLGTRLLNRTTRSLSLTDAGQLYLNQIRGVIDDIDRVEDTLASLNHEPIGSLRIAAPVMFGMRMLAPLIRSFKLLHPKVVPEVTIVDRHVDLVSEGYDVGLTVAQRVSGANTVKRPLTTLEMVACTSPTYLERRGRPSHPSELEHHDCLTCQVDFAGEIVSFDGHDAAIDVQPRRAAASNNIGMLREFALGGMGVAIVPRFVVAEDLEARRLVPILDAFTIPAVQICITYPSRRHFPRKSRLFIDHVLDHFEQ